VDVVEDVAWAYEPPKLTHDGRSPVVGLSIRHARQYPLEMFVPWCEHVLRRRCALRLMPLQKCYDPRWNDYYLHAELRDRLPEALRPQVEILPPAFDLELQAASLRWCDWYVGTRLHGLIVALKHGRPILPVTVGPARKFVQVLRKVGLDGWWILDRRPEDFCGLLDHLIDGHVDFGGVAHRVDRLEAAARRQLHDFRRRVLAGR